MCLETTISSPFLDVTFPLQVVKKLIFSKFILKIVQIRAKSVKFSTKYVILDCLIALIHPSVPRSPGPNPEFNLVQFFNSFANAF
jgi:hypothetical protein